jgi:hypothetical protein
MDTALQEQHAGGASPKSGAGQTQLAAYVAANGPELTFRRTSLVVEGLSGEGSLATGTFASKRARYLGVLCINARVVGRPGAEVWAVMSGRRNVVRFAVVNGAIEELAG